MDNFLKVSCILHLRTAEDNDTLIENLYDDAIYNYFDGYADDSLFGCESIRLAPMDPLEGFTSYPSVYLYILYFDIPHIKDMNGLKEHITQNFKNAHMEGTFFTYYEICDDVIEVTKDEAVD